MLEKEITTNNQITLHERVRILEDREAIRDLKVQYAHALDSYDIEAFLDLFDEDAIWQGNDNTYQGKEALRKIVSDSFDIMPFYVHMYVSPIINILSETEAKGTWYMFEPETLVVNGEEKAVWVCARYDETYEKIDGTWKFKTVTVHMYFQTSFDKGWLREQRASGGVKS